MTPTQEQLNKLPKWAQDHIRDIQRQRDIAVLRLDEMVDSQTPSPIYIDELDCTENGSPKCRRTYIQSNRICVEYAGVTLSIYCPQPNDSQRLYGIDLSYSETKSRSGYVAIISRSFGNIQLLTKENIPNR